MGVIDIHIHIQPLWQLKPSVLEVMKEGHDNFDDLMAIMKDPERLLRVLDSCDIEKAGLINYVSPDIMGFTDEVNSYIVDYTKGRRDRLIPFGSINPRFSKDPEGEMDLLVEKMGIQGIKIHPPHQLFYPNDYVNGMKALEIMYQKAEESGIPIMFHTGTSIFPGARAKYGDPIYIDDVAVDFPKLVIILAHGGRPFWMDTSFFLIRRHPNVYMDISGVPPKKLLQYFPRLEEIAHKTLFGTDWPGPMVKSMKDNIETFKNLPLSEEAKKMILRETALKIFG
jgi:predicted TIM-barrel fold metal-dependent hydrolase